MRRRRVGKTLHTHVPTIYRIFIILHCKSFIVIRINWKIQIFNNCNIKRKLAVKKKNILKERVKKESENNSKQTSAERMSVKKKMKRRKKKRKGNK